jgi:hypothetical protein
LFGKNNGREELKIVAERTGLEPATPGVTGRYSNQLNYRSTYLQTQYYVKPKSYIVTYKILVGVAGVEPATYAL